MSEEKNKKTNHKRSGVRRSLLAVTLIPLITFCIVILAMSYKQLSNTIEGEVEFGLKSVAQSAVRLYEKEYPGAYSYDKDSEKIRKGDKEIDGMLEQLNELKKISGTDISIFYQDLLILTTISEEGESLVGTKANSIIRSDILEGQTEKFYAKTELGEKPYFSYFSPMYDESGKCVGMIFAGKESSYVSGVIWKGILPLMAVIVILMVAIISLITWYSGKMTSDLKRVRQFLHNLEKENLTAELSSQVMAREDEIGEIGHSAVEMQHALIESLERDGLTKLYNRHYGEKWLNQMIVENKKTGDTFYIAIADIDFFKKFNDQYGHDCGDLVLKEVSAILKEGMENKGYAIRWGGEEFLLLFYAKTFEEAKNRVEHIAYRIKHKLISYQEKNLNVTITLGFVQGFGELSSDELVKEADQALYEGKENGRDCVVYHDVVPKEEENEPEVKNEAGVEDTTDTKGEDSE